MSTPVHIVSGFLGTGKTTALLHQIDTRDERIAVLVNDFGEAAIDREVVADTGTLALTEIRGACVCCTAPEGFTDAVGTLLDEVEADRIFVEPTGLARPADLVDTLLRGPHADRIALGPVVVLVDPATLEPGRVEATPILREQIEAADIVVANRTDLASEADLERFDQWVDALWPAPLGVYRTTQGRLPPAAFEWPEGTGPKAPTQQTHDNHHHHADSEGGAGAADKHAVARSWVWSPEVRFSRDRLDEAFARLAGGETGAPALRAKGLFRTLEGTWLLEVAGDAVHQRPSGHRRDSRVDVILAGDDEGPLEQAGDLLAGATLTEQEMQIDPQQVEVVRPDGTRLILDRSALRALPGQVPDIEPLVPGRQGAAARVGEVLERAGLTEGAEAVVVAADGYATPPVPVESLHPGLLVHTLGDSPLPDDKGGPFRLFIPGDAGPGGPCANVKSVVRIALRTPE